MNKWERFKAGECYEDDCSAPRRLAKGYLSDWCPEHANGCELCYAQPIDDGDSWCDEHREAMQERYGAHIYYVADLDDDQFEDYEALLKELE